MWHNCKLEGDELARKVGELLGDHYSCWGSAVESFAWLVESQQIFLTPPHNVEWRAGNKRHSQEVQEWRATVSQRVRTYPHKHAPHLGTVGRGAGPDPATAALRAVVASFGPAE